MSYARLSLRTGDISMTEGASYRRSYLLPDGTVLYHVLFNSGADLIVQSGDGWFKIFDKEFRVKCNELLFVSCDVLRFDVMYVHLFDRQQLGHLSIRAGEPWFDSERCGRACSNRLLAKVKMLYG